MNKVTRESIFKDASKRMRIDFEDARNNVPHRGEAGGEGEQIVKNFINDHIPGRFKCTGGFIIDKKDKITGHNDVIIYDSFNCPVYRTSERGMIIPNDNAAAIVEVKFDLTTTLLDSSFKKIHETMNLEKTPHSISHQISEQIATYGIVFAFESKLSTLTIVDRWLSNLTETNPIYKSCDMIVILDKGIFTTVIQVPGEGISPINLQHLAPVPDGTKIGVGFIETKDETLDIMMRLLLAHLSLFRNRIDHPGFDFRKYGKVGAKWLLEYGDIK